MSSKVQPVSGMEDTVQTATKSTASVSSTVSPKVSLFAKKTGFVIPKNKLSGSLVPVFRGSKKPGGASVASEESTKQVLRKTKWGPDLTQDAFVRKGRASAYQTRLDQITQQLKSRNDHDSPADQESSNDQKSELELERSEIIGEILKLNPSYKAPTDYKPLLKEEKVAIPIKEYPGRNFIGLIFGPAGDTQKRLEKETGAKIRVYGTNADTKKETEITSSDGNETHSDYEELYVLVTAETYKKVDAAVSLIQLLITPVLANTVSVSTNDPVSEDSQNLVNQGVVQSTGSEPTPAQPLARFQPYPNQWVPSGQSSGFIAPQFPTLSTPSNSAPVSSSFGPRGSVPHNQQPIFQHPIMGHPGPPRNSLPPSQVSPRQPNFSSLSFTPTGPNQNVRPMGSPIGWSQRPAGSPRTLRPNMPQPGPTPSVGLQTGPPNPVPNSWFPSPTTSTSIPPPSIKTPPITALRPPRPVSNDFTFQTHRPQTPAGSQFMPPQNPQIRPPQLPSFRPGMNNHDAPPIMQGFNRPQNIQMGQHQGPSVMPPPSDRQPFFPGHGQRPSATHVGPRQFGPGPGPGPGPRSPARPFPPRPGNFGLVQQNQNHASMGFRPQNFVAPLNQQFRGNIPFSLGRPGFNQSRPQQVYDPFSPTDVARKPGNHQNARKQDNDPEYDDLMASVGVK